MVAIEEICIKCGCKFLRGIFPQKTCDCCSESKTWVLIKEDRLENKNTKK